MIITSKIDKRQEYGPIAIINLNLLSFPYPMCKKTLAISN